MNDAEPAERWKAQHFCTTHWSVVLKAGYSGPDARAALEQLCESYWYPLYTFVRRKGNSPEDAEDLIQGFFEHLLGADFLRNVEAGKGKFRTFLLASLTNFISNEWARKNRLKRGGGRQIVSIDAEDAETRYKLEPVETVTPEKLFERSWAETVVARVASRLRREYEKGGELERFEHLKIFLMTNSAETSYSELGVALGLSEGGVKTCVRRLRLRFGDLLREELAPKLWTTPAKLMKKSALSSCPSRVSALGRNLRLQFCLIVVWPSRRLRAINVPLVPNVKFVIN